MIKVKEYLDKEFRQMWDAKEVVADLKKNGHYCVHGAWIYPHDFEYPPADDRRLGVIDLKDHIGVHINNETILLDRIVIDGVCPGKYGYLQTYEHIPRIGPDKNGYFARSTDEEVIRYIDKFLQHIKYNEQNKQNKIKHPTTMENKAQAATSTKVKCTCVSKKESTNYNKDFPVSTAIELQVPYDQNSIYYQMSGGTMLTLNTVNPSAAAMFKLGGEYDIVIGPTNE
jgi:hypothetical protein